MNPGPPRARFAFKHLAANPKKSKFIKKNINSIRLYPSGAI